MDPIRSYYVPSFSEENVEVVLLRLPAEISLAVEFQEAASLDHFIIRHLPREGTYLMGEKIQLLNGRSAWVGADLRTDIPCEQEMMETFRSQHPDLFIRGVAGFANITMNPAFVAWANGSLACTRPDVDRITDEDPAFGGLVVERDGSIGFSNDIHFQNDGERGSHLRLKIAGSDVTEKTRFVACGPRLVREGVAINADQLKTSVLNMEWYDLRHVILFPHIHWPDPKLERFDPLNDGDVLSINPGLEVFWRSDGGLNADAIEAFFAGEPVDIDLKAYTEVDAYPYFKRYGTQIGVDRLLEAFEARGYRPTNGTTPNRGEYCIRGKRMAVTFLPGIYNHSLAGIGRDGRFLWMGVKGLGGRAGVTVTDTAQLAADAGFADAIVCDNGGDVHLRLNENPASDTFTDILLSSNNRCRFRGLLLFVERKTGGGGLLSITSRTTLPKAPIGDLRRLL
ncbi:hypothetical protein KKG90_06210 [Candidatus Bipolaricaulota bacterium]|nr:hypothetical protein [Candidatus Bipolaricaulota bacterium]